MLMDAQEIEFAEDEDQSEDNSHNDGNSMDTRTQHLRAKICIIMAAAYQIENEFSESDMSDQDYEEEEAPNSECEYEKEDDHLLPTDCISPVPKECIKRTGRALSLKTLLTLKAQTSTVVQLPCSTLKRTPFFLGVSWNCKPLNIGVQIWRTR
uniref:Uncharacterized protein n=1 Tax=Ditylenchus dipsaci TaxID=166011 RepID=A0A915CWP9_9BILA